MGMLALKILGPLVLLLAVAGWGKLGWNHYHSEQDRHAALVAVVGGVAGKATLKPKDAPAAVRAIGAERDRQQQRAVDAESQRDTARKALGDQTARVIEMGEQAKARRAEADRFRDQVKKLTAQRAELMRRAQAATTRTEKLSLEGEAAQCEEAMDAVFQAGF